MKTLICTKVGKNTSISINSQYEVISETNTRYSFINDKGVQKNYCKSLFRVVENVPPPPPAPLIRTITELNAELNLNNERFVLNVTSNDNLINVETQFTVNIEGLNISCGIHQALGLNAIFQGLNTVKTYITNNLNQTLVLADDLNIDNFILDILENIIQEIIDNTETGMILLSTNVTNNAAVKEIYINKLNELSRTSVTTTNPNSGNDITLWTIVSSRRLIIKAS